MLEDVLDSEADAAFARDHDARGVFRPTEEWLALFDALGLRVVASGDCNDGEYFQYSQKFFALAVDNSTGHEPAGT